MVSSRRHAISGLLVLFSLVVLVHAQTVPTKEATSTISGRITIKDKGAPGIVVGLRRQEQGYNQRSTLYRGVTDLNGDYRIANVPAGNYHVIPVVPVYVLPEGLGARTLIVDKGENIENVDFALVRGGVITGKVVDPDGRPAIEEEVALLPSARSGGGYYYQQYSARTDDRGVYRIFGIPAGSYRVAAGRDEENSYPGKNYGAYKRTFHPGVLEPTQAEIIEVSEGGEATNVDITLSRALSMYSVSGRLVDGDTGQPLANLSYGLTHFVSDYHTSSWGSGAVSNARGEFKIDGLVPGKYGVSLRQGSPNSNGWRADLVRFEIIDQNVTGLIVKCKRGAIISGVVVLEGTDDKTMREQLSRTGLTASIAESRDQPWGQWTLIAPDGSFRMTGLRSGLTNFYFPTSTRFKVVRVEQGGVIQPRGIEVSEGQEITGVRVVVNYGNASIRGVIELENGVIPQNSRFFVNLTKPGEDQNRFFSPDPQIDARGQFIIDGLIPGSYELRVGLYILGTPPTVIEKTQEVVVSAGGTTNVSVKLDLNSNKRP